MLNRLRLWAINKLGGVERLRCVDFSRQYLTDGRVPLIGASCGQHHLNGVACVDDGVHLVGCVIERHDGAPAVVVAPWCRGLVMAGSFCDVRTLDVGNKQA